MLLRFQYSQVHLGGQAKLTLYAKNSTEAESAARPAFARLVVLEDILSDWRPQSELSRLTRNPVEKPVPLSRELCSVLVRAQCVAVQTDGIFDITIAPLVHLWRRSRQSEQLPTPAELRAAKARVGYQNLIVDAKTRTATLLRPDLQLDLGGIAKGFCGDEAIRILRREGIRHALIEMGGDIVATAPPPGQKAWRIARGSTIFPLSGGALSTSGSTQQFVTIGRRRYAHLVDPHTGLGVSNVTEVSIAAPDGLTADPLATAACLLSAKETQALLAQWRNVRRV